MALLDGPFESVVRPVVSHNYTAWIECDYCCTKQNCRLIYLDDVPVLSVCETCDSAN